MTVRGDSEDARPEPDEHVAAFVEVLKRHGLRIAPTVSSEDGPGDMWTAAHEIRAAELLRLQVADQGEDSGGSEAASSAAAILQVRVDRAESTLQSLIDRHPDAVHGEHPAVDIARAYFAAVDAPLDDVECCQSCGRSCGTWFAPSEVWNVVPDGVGMLCPPCFMAVAESRGLHPTGWLLVPEPWEPEIRAHFGLPGESVTHRESRERSEPLSSDRVALQEAERALRELREGSLEILALTFAALGCTDDSLADFIPEAVWTSLHDRKLVSSGRDITDEGYTLTTREGHDFLEQSIEAIVAALAAAAAPSGPDEQAETGGEQGSPSDAEIAEALWLLKDSGLGDSLVPGIKALFEALGEEQIALERAESALVTYDESESAERGTPWVRAARPPCAACEGDPEAHDLHICGREPGA